jgi:prolyl-tRNA synthetase family II
VPQRAGAGGRRSRGHGVGFRAVEADTGAIGGSRSHEFQVLADSGEDAIVSCEQCEYAANVEKAAIGGGAASDPKAESGGATSERSAASAGEQASTPLRKVATPGQRTVEEVSAFLRVPAARFVKSLVYVVDGGDAVLAMVRGDHALSEAKLKDALGAQTVVLASEDVVVRVTGAPVGFAGPIGLPGDLRRIADRALAELAEGLAGANEADQHLVGVSYARDLGAVELADLRVAAAGDPCPRCDGRFVLQRGIEVGQVFHLGTKYSAAMHATVLDAEGAERVLEMGCYGIGVTRIAAAAVEQNHDDDGIIWPMALAPFHVSIVTAGKEPELAAAAEQLDRELAALVAVVVEHLDAALGQVGLQRLGGGGQLGLLAGGDDQHLERRQRHRPLEAVGIVVLLDGGGDDARDADAVAAHDHRPELAVVAEVGAAHRLGVLGAEEEDVPDLDAEEALEGASAAARAQVAGGGDAQVGDLQRGRGGIGVHLFGVRFDGMANY